MKDNSTLSNNPRMAHIHANGGHEAKETELIERRGKHFAGSFLFYHDPVHLVRGEGVYLYDAQGNEYLDFYNNVQSMGHANPKVVEAIREQAGILTTHTRYLNEKVIEFAEEAASTLPDALEVCLFVCTGTEACELAVRIARSVTGSNGLIVMENSYHGNSKLVTEMSTAYPETLRGDTPHIEAIEPPNTYRGSFRLDGDNDQLLGQQYADLAESAIDKLQRRDQGLAAFVCDSIFDSNGALDAPQDYFQKLSDKVHSAGGLMIADEVQAGVCRTGTFWGFEQYDFVPDIVFTGKPLGAGFPVAAVFTTRQIADKWASQDMYFNTFGGNPVASAAGKAVLQFAKEQNMTEHVQAVGAYLQTQLVELADKHPIIGNVQGKGLFLGIDLVKDRATREPASELAAKIPDAMKQKGVLIGLTGAFGNCLKFRPPLVVEKPDIDRVIVALDEVLSELSDNKDNR
ncbi:aspartate aminotransferase family protein [Motiliproteus coralliicola]|uniref:Aspartate aminotransferase family protein n=1 Tax=Motiliproteus coralliicola TaxID=2283196 RepID=A0A369WSK7_9GAMM|nr:aspartate aminotransferase family protein [Motiliproteus coralliicola]RDE24657.1 aspartate aminotransferase family protein [Motiliproteus coralliicola]